MIYRMTVVRILVDPVDCAKACYPPPIVSKKHKTSCYSIPAEQRCRLVEKERCTDYKRTAGTHGHDSNEATMRAIDPLLCGSRLGSE